MAHATLIEDVPFYLVRINDDVMMTLRLSPGTLRDPSENATPTSTPRQEGTRVYELRIRNCPWYTACSGSPHDALHSSSLPIYLSIYIYIYMYVCTVRAYSVYTFCPICAHCNWGERSKPQTCGENGIYIYGTSPHFVTRDIRYIAIIKYTVLVFGLRTLSSECKR